MNGENSQSFELSGKDRKKAFFDAVDIKGLSSKRARAFSAGRVAKLLRLISRYLAFTPARVYGLTFLSFGVLTLFLHLGGYYFMDDPRIEASSLVIGAVFALFSVFLIISDKPICMALQSSKIIDFIVFDFFSINRMQNSAQERGLGGAVGIIFGFLLSVFGFFFPTEYAVLVLLGLIFVTVSMVSPEFPYIFSLLIFPYLSFVENSTVLFAALIAITVISFGRKVLIGKRIYSFEIYDFLFLFLIIAVLITGVIFGGDGSRRGSLLITVFALGYIPASNIAVNRRLFDCVSGAIVTASVPVGLYTVISYAVRLIFYEREPSGEFFDSPEILAVYLAAVSIFSLYLSVKRSRIVKKRYYLAVFILSFLALLTTECFAIPIAIFFLILSFLVFRDKRVSPLYLYLLILLPLLLFLFSDPVLFDISQSMSVFPSLVERRDALLSSLSYFADNLFLGGAAHGAADSDFSYNVYVGIACRFGILALMIFLLLLILRVLHLSVYKKYFSHSTVNFYVEMTTLASVAILMFGSYLDVFREPLMVYFFVAVFATGSAALRVSKKEKEERLSYYKALGSSDSAAIDVSLKR